MAIKTNEVFIVSAKRTPIGSFLGSLSTLTATQLGSMAIREAYLTAGVAPENISSVYMGNVLSANLGQSPARQASRLAGIPDEVDCTTVNKVCAAGMKATVLGSQQIQLGLEELVMTGGMENMSKTPHYSSLRSTLKLGDGSFVDGLLRDGLIDAYESIHMGSMAEITVDEYKLTRAQQDDFALRSYTKAIEATKQGKFEKEIVPVSIMNKSTELTINEDEDIYKVIPEKVAKLKPSFKESGTITAANASNLNDGAAAILLASQSAIDKYGLMPLAKIVSYADAAQEPRMFTTAPSLAIPLALRRAGLKISEIDFFEINEAYSAVVLANQKILGFPIDRTNVYGGAVALGHPLGASGARIICTLISVLRQEGGKYGVAAICNGGGGASAIVIENVGI